jgi:glycosyl transferase family 2
VIVTWLAAGLLVYVYAGYPLLLLILTRGRRVLPAPIPARWPSLTITLPVYNGADAVRAALTQVLASIYPGERQVLVVSDGSTDGTNEVVAAFADRGVELLPLPRRVGKTEAENLAMPHIRGELVANTDVSVRIHPDAIVALVAAMAEPSVGVASSRDVSVDPGQQVNEGETSYVGYEMWIRDLETAAGGIVGASGSLYVTRASLHKRHLAGHLSRDFSSALHARAHGFRAVSVPSAICFVPRSGGRGHEYRRKVRTMARGLATLAHHAPLLDPARHGRFAWMLWSHKLLRWLTPFALVALGLAALLPGTGTTWSRLVAVVGVGIAALGWWWPGTKVPRALAIPAYGTGAVLAGLHAWWVALTGGALPVWEPTRRGVATTPHAGRS